MVLDSQRNRPEPVRGMFSGRRGLWMRLTLAAAGVVVVGGAAYQFWPARESGESDARLAANIVAAGGEGAVPPGDPAAQAPDPGAGRLLLAGTSVTSSPVSPSPASTVPALSTAIPAPAATQPAPATQPVAATAPAPMPPTTSVDMTAGVVTTPEAAQTAREAMALLDQGKLLEARVMFNRLLVEQSRQMSPSDLQRVREAMTQINQDLVFSSRVQTGDTLAEWYTVQSNDLLARIAPRFKVPYQLLELVNRVDARRIRVDQKLKVIKGPFHAVVHKAAFRMDVFLHDPEGRPVYIRSFTVGLGEDNSTPVGNWVVNRTGKLANPGWTHPRTGKYYAPDDPANPIGEFWIGLEGTEERTSGKRGYGIHGTIEPESIGRQASLGCVRMAAEDIALVYKLLVERHSTVRIEP